MEDEKRSKNSPDAPRDLKPASNIPNQKPKKPKKSRGTSKKANQDMKQSYRRSWQSASPMRKIEIILGAVVAAGGICYLGVAFWGNLQTKWNSEAQRLQTEQLFKAEHRPRVIFVRPPLLFGPVHCEVTEKAIKLQTGPVRIWVRNTAKDDSIATFVVGPIFKLVLNKKIGIPAFDDLPTITDDTCKLSLIPERMKEFPLNGGQEFVVGMGDTVAAFSLLSSNSSIDTNGNVVPPPGERVPRAPIKSDAIFQLYAPVCVYYLGMIVSSTEPAPLIGLS
jgi:hypothetical protein